MSKVFFSKKYGDEKNHYLRLTGRVCLESSYWTNIPSGSKPLTSDPCDRLEDKLCSLPPPPQAAAASG